MLAAALGRYVGDGPFQNLQQRLLHPFARDIARDGGVFALARDLVNFVNVNDAVLGAPDVVPGVLNELQNDVLDVLAHVAGLGERGGVGQRERHVEQPGQRLREKGFTRSRGADEQNIGLRQFHVAPARVAR